MKNKNYASIVQITGYPIKGHKYKIQFLMPRKPELIKIAKLCYMEKEKFSKDESRYCEMFEYLFLNNILEKYDNSMDGNNWDCKESSFEPSESYLGLVNAMEIKEFKPTIITIWFYSNKKIKTNEIDSQIKDYFIEKFGADYLALYLNITKLKELPKELVRKTIGKIPLDNIINEMLKNPTTDSKECK